MKEKFMRTMVVMVLMLCFCVEIPAQKAALKSNILYDATTSINLGTEIGLGNKFSLDFSATVNPWDFSKDEKMIFWLLQPELRFWFCQEFQGNFLALHAHYAQYNLNKIEAFGPQLDKRYEGWLTGGGIGFGHQWLLGNRWSLEGEIGIGYAYLKYDKYPCIHCGSRISTEHKHYIGPTKAALSLVYFMK